MFMLKCSSLATYPDCEKGAGPLKLGPPVGAPAHPGPEPGPPGYGSPRDDGPKGPGPKPPRPYIAFGPDEDKYLGVMHEKIWLPSNHQPTNTMLTESKESLP